MFFIFEAILGFGFLIVVMGKLIISDGKKYRGQGTLMNFYIKKFLYQTLMLVLAFFLLIFMVNQTNLIWSLICAALVIGAYYYMLTISHNTIPKSRYVNLATLLFFMLTIYLDTFALLGYIACFIILGIKLKFAYNKALTEPINTEAYNETYTEAYNNENVYSESYSEDSENEFNFFEEEQYNGWGYQEEEESDFLASDNNNSYEEEEDRRQQFDRMDIANTDWNKQNLDDIIF